MLIVSSLKTNFIDVMLSPILLTSTIFFFFNLNFIYDFPLLLVILVQEWIIQSPSPSRKGFTNNLYKCFSVVNKIDGGIYLSKGKKD